MRAEAKGFEQHADRLEALVTSVIERPLGLQQKSEIEVALNGEAGREVRRVVPLKDRH